MDGPSVDGGGDAGNAVRPWWEGAVFYQIYPRSFADADGDGVGDLAGIRRRLGHLVDLGVDALWLSPFYRSPMADFGYDVSDYCDVDPLFGTLDDVDRLVEDVHQAGMRIIVDWVPHHTSSEHPWFVDARSSRDSRHRRWYVWRDPGPDGGPPNNWRAAFDPDAPAWTFDPASGQWYLHLFEASQPDLNWDEPEVRAAMAEVLRFWLDRGVDGFRADVVHCIGKDPALPDDPPDLAGLPHAVLNDVPATHGRLRDLRALLDSYPGERMMVGEVYLLSTAAVAAYYGAGDELHLAFNFPPLFAPWQADAWRDQVVEVDRELGRRGAWPTWVLSNHDNPRHRTRYDMGASWAGEDEATRERRSERRARSAAVLLLGLRGTPFLYQGEELGLGDVDVPADRRVDPGGRDGCRGPVPWDASPDHGWPVSPGASPWLPLPADAATRNAESAWADSGSVLRLYQRLLAARRASPALRHGEQRLLDTPSGVLGLERTGGGAAADGAGEDGAGGDGDAVGDRRVVLVNFTDDDRQVRLEPPGPGLVWRVEVAGDGTGEGQAWNAALGPDQAVVLKPAAR
ncbi:MAG: alpha-amylase family glycosyl hydrolase [Actinomycetota bacterium]|nr:alpha-amylase family glycosyl hydrolase [Actinomycetota bacterium]